MKYNTVGHLRVSQIPSPTTSSNSCQGEHQPTYVLSHITLENETIHGYTHAPILAGLNSSDRRMGVERHSRSKDLLDDRKNQPSQDASGDIGSRWTKLSRDQALHILASRIIGFKSGMDR